jgi:hypothetical protein
MSITDRPDGKRLACTYVGLMLVIFSPELDLTNSLLMKSPVGNVILRPLGAVSSTFRSAMLKDLDRADEDCRNTVSEAELLQETIVADVGMRDIDLARHFNM